jgi:hypothetical protein
VSDEQRHYPVRPVPDDDPRFAFGLVLDVARVLEQHGYPKVAHGRDLVDLQQALFTFLYGPRDYPNTIKETSE